MVFGFCAAAVARSRVSQGSTGPRPKLAGPVGQAGQGGERGGQGDPAGEPRGRRAGLRWRLAPPGRESWPRSRSSKARARSSSVPPSSPAAFSSWARAVIRSSAASTSVRGQFPARQRGVAGVLGPPFHPGEPRRGLPAFPRLVRGGLHNGAGDRGAQPAGGQPPGPVQNPGLGGGGPRPSSSRPVAAAISRALPRLTMPSRSAARVPGRQVSRCPAVPVSSSARNRDSPSAFAIWSAVNSASSGRGVPPESSATDGEFAGRGVGLDPVPPAHDADQLGLGDCGEPVVSRGGVRGDRQLRAAGQHVEGHPGAEPGRRAGRLAGEDPGRAGLARAAPPGAAASTASSSSAAASPDLRRAPPR